MRHLIWAASSISIATLAACAGGTTAPQAPQQVALAAARSSICVAAQGTPQTVQLPDTGGVHAALSLGTYDSGATGCQNITIATGADVATAAATARRTESVSSGAPAPIISVTLGQGLPASSSVLQLTTVLSGATLTTDPTVVFPDGTYNATITLNQLGTSFTYSLVFTASGGTLTITGGSALPLTLGSGAVIQIYNRGVHKPRRAQARPPYRAPRRCRVRAQSRPQSRRQPRLLRRRQRRIPAPPCPPTARRLEARPSPSITAQAKAATAT
jgi:hypothetical protein